MPPSAEISATVRRGQPASVCQVGLLSYGLHPDVEPAHACSYQAPVASWNRLVAPTAKTVDAAAGHVVPLE